MPCDPPSGRLDGPHVVRQQGLPAATIPIAPRLAFGPEALPSPMLDLDPGRLVGERDEADLDLGRLLGRPLEMPAVDEPLRRLPDLNTAPVPLEPIPGALEDPAADAALEHDLKPADAGVRVVGRPPA